ncbi:hypothetical protein RB195_005919 [Necator americanus]|uniref:L-Fucosyltransferase n=1 Tax=Necator americanus TaxID=51031 RepID=A0ABR1BTZ9_NECAM
MFRIASGYGIAKRLGRTLYFNTSAKYEQSGKVHKMLEHIQDIFPRSIEAFKLIKSEVIFETVPFADDEQGRETCCKYEDPLRYINNSAKFLELNTALVQNPLYFQDVMPDIREMFNFGECAIEAGMKKVRKMKMRNNYAICVHTRRTDFKRFGAASDLVLTLSATQRIAKENILQNLTEYVIFGDDQDFMGKLAKELRKNGSTNDEIVHISRHSELEDFFISSQVCKAFLISAPVSTFGWWLAFFAPNQDSVYYMNDTNAHILFRKRITKELFLRNWKLLQV